MRRLIARIAALGAQIFVLMACVITPIGVGIMAPLCAATPPDATLCVRDAWVNPETGRVPRPSDAAPLGVKELLLRSAVIDKSPLGSNPTQFIVVIVTDISLWPSWSKHTLEGRAVLNELPIGIKEGEIIYPYPFGIVLRLTVSKQDYGIDETPAKYSEGEWMLWSEMVKGKRQSKADYVRANIDVIGAEEIFQELLQKLQTERAIMAQNLYDARISYSDIRAKFVKDIFQWSCQEAVRRQNVAYTVMAQRMHSLTVSGVDIDDIRLEGYRVYRAQLDAYPMFQNDTHYKFCSRLIPEFALLESQALHLEQELTALDMEIMKMVGDYDMLQLTAVNK